MALNWNQPLRTKHSPSREATLLDGSGPRGQRRVAVLGDFAASRPKNDPKSQWLTTFLYNENGTLDADTGAFTLENAA
ncbi:hypothetical protein [Sphingomonas beigongshangi]|uniref:hypothetical protein n=1 Tax=Sphingomonas beigongshangi TaxID=2782540 RepID=UPI00193C3F2A|nr:hypothetical protein [Sphingomonas beigongshangi]